MSSRPSPNDSATLFKIGTIKKGNDGNKWIIAENKNGVKRWKKYTTLSSTNTKKFYVKLDKNNVIKEFKFPSIKYFKKVDEIYIKSKIVAGEFDFGPENGFSRFGKGKYNIYKIDDNLAVSKKILKESDIINTTFKHAGGFVGVDAGMFGFWDMQYVEALAKIEMKKNKKRSRYDKYNIPDFVESTIKLNMNKPRIIEIGDFENADDYIDAGLDEDQQVGVVMNTGVGDGTFSVFASKDILLLLGGKSEQKILKL